MPSLIEQLRPTLFWDVNPAKLDAALHAKQIIQRVVERGTLEEWRVTRKHYGDEKMRTVVTRVRSLSPRDVALCCVAFDLTPKDFRCCTSHPFPTAPSFY
jgi:hypothetical protein